MKLKIDKAAINEHFQRITEDKSEKDRDELTKCAAKMAVRGRNSSTHVIVERLMVYFDAIVRAIPFDN